jgi:hypothetical protein
MDVFLLPSGRDSCFLFTSHKGGWIELAAFVGWPEPRAHWWSGSDYRDTGPFKLWAAHRSNARYQIWLREGQLILPRIGPGQGILDEGAYDRAAQLGFPGMLSNGDPGWIMVRRWEIKFPFVYPMAATSVLPLAWIIAGYIGRSRRAGRGRAGLCRECGYDLRGTAAAAAAAAGRCPECGGAVAG